MKTKIGWHFSEPFYHYNLMHFTASVHLPRIGHSTPNFNWYGTERLIRKYLASKGIPTYMYPYSNFIPALSSVLFWRWSLTVIVYKATIFLVKVLNTTNSIQPSHKLILHILSRAQALLSQAWPRLFFPQTVNLWKIFLLEWISFSVRWTLKREESNSLDT